MRSCLDIAERDRRWTNMSAAMRTAGYAAVLFVANDHRGHKGTLRYVADFNLYHRWGYAVMRPGEEPALFLPTILADLDRSRWVSDHRFSDAPIVAVADALQVLGAGARIGIAGLGQAMRAGEYLRLAALLPGFVLEDATSWFETVRLRKSAHEIAGLEEAAIIADLCFESLLDIARPGDTERQLGARMLDICMRAGGEDPLFLTMNPTVVEGRARPLLSPPRDRELGTSGAFTFSFEMIGPSGYWTEMCRTIAFSRSAPTLEAAVEVGCVAMEAGRLAMRPGGVVGDVQAAAAAAVDPERFELSAWSGHSIGQDVVEAPLIGPVQPAGVSPDIVPGMAMAFHPMFVDRAPMGHLFYMADIFVVEKELTRRLSAWPATLYRRSLGVSCRSA